ncbi:MAG: transglutaminase domain-containing protein [Oscillospiraceae bacterium]|nr:transglutaminase domain-containing protein [Oscillospiraceae bacterium]
MNYDLPTSLTPAQQHAMEFLLTHLPQSDLDCYDHTLFLCFVDHALALREHAPWCAELEEEIFLHYVLFPRVNDEDLSFHRALFHDTLWERIRTLPTTEEKILEINRWCHEIASYQMQDDRTASPLTVFRCGSGRCGEESAFLVSALRSVGIAARQVYSPRWAHCDDNHAWVEALCDGQWRFLGACEPEPILDRGWFNVSASRALIVHSRVFGSSSHPLHGEVIGTDGGVTWYNQTTRYAKTVRQTLRAICGDHPAAGAVFQIQVLNEASFHTIATLTADTQGKAELDIGAGDFHIFCQSGGYSAECDCTAGDEICLSLELIHNHNTSWCTVDFHAPVDAPIHPAHLTDAQKQERTAVLSHGTALRENRLAAMCPEAHRTNPIAVLARGNAQEILNFLHRDNSPAREMLVQTLTDKDLRDTSDNLLTSHFNFLPPKNQIPEEIYRDFLICPRIALECLTPWREALHDIFSTQEREQFCTNPAALWEVLSTRQNTTVFNIYSNLVWTPAGAWCAGRCDLRSLRILYVALLRTLGIPARLRPLDAAPEFWQDKAWHTVSPENFGTLCLTAGDTTPHYRQNWTLSRRTASGWTLLHLNDDNWHDRKYTVSLPTGQYRITTSIRLPNGNQFSAYRDFTLDAEKSVEIALLFRTYALTEMLRCQQLPVMSAQTLQEETVPDLCRINNRASVLFWLEEGSEPTEHTLNELLSNPLVSQPVNIVFLVRTREALSQPTLARTLAQHPEILVLLDDWTFDVDMVARCLTCDSERPPLAVVCDRSGNAVYGVSGYHVGSVELLSRIVQHITSKL